MRILKILSIMYLEPSLKSAGLRILHSSLQSQLASARSTVENSFHRLSEHTKRFIADVIAWFQCLLETFYKVFQTLLKKQKEGIVLMYRTDLIVLYEFLRSFESKFNLPETVPQCALV